MRFGSSYWSVLAGCSAACGPTSHRDGDEWDEGPSRAGDHRRQRQGRGALAARARRPIPGATTPACSPTIRRRPRPTYAATSDIPPLDFVGPPEPPSSWDNMQKGGTQVRQGVLLDHDGLRDARHDGGAVSVDDLAPVGSAARADNARASARRGAGSCSCSARVTGPGRAVADARALDAYDRQHLDRRRGEQHLVGARAAARRVSGRSTSGTPARRASVVST